MQKCQPCACKHGRCNPFKQKALANLQGLFTCRVIWRKERDSNPRYRKTCKPDFESGAFDHSAIFPQMFGLAVAPVVWRRVQNLPEGRYCSASARCYHPNPLPPCRFFRALCCSLSHTTQSPSLAPRAHGLPRMVCVRRARDDWHCVAHAIRADGVMHIACLRHMVRMAALATYCSTCAAYICICGDMHRHSATRVSQPVQQRPRD